jgi:hypothetical protein
MTIIAMPHIDRSFIGAPADVSEWHMIDGLDRGVTMTTVGRCGNAARGEALALP